MYTVVAIPQKRGFLSNTTSPHGRSDDPYREERLNVATLRLLVLLSSTFTFTFFHSRLLVGAPNAESGQPNVERAGAVYKCAAETPGSCELIPFDTKGKIDRKKRREREKLERKFFLGGRGGRAVRVSLYWGVACFSSGAVYSGGSLILVN